MFKPMNPTSFRRKALYLGTAAAVLSALSPLAAAEEKLALEEILVTAQKQEESVNDVPSTVNVLTGSSMEELSVLNFSELQQMTPGLTFTSVGVRSNSVSLRGISNDSFSGAPQAVQIYWNDMLIPPELSFRPMYDLARVEVLRGPQGSLQGTTSPAGAIMLVTEKPDLVERNAQIQTSVSERGGFNTQFGASLPLISERLSVRIAGVYDENPGQRIQNIDSGTKQSEDTDAARLSVKWQASDTIDVTLVTEYTEQDKDVFVPVAGDDGPGGLPTLTPFARKSLEEVDSYIKLRNQLATLTVNWDIPGHTLTSLTGYIKRSSDDFSDNDFANRGPGPQLEWVYTEAEEYTQELRIASHNSSFWEYMLGAYYNRLDEFTDFDQAAAAGSNFIIEILVPRRHEAFGIFTHNTLHINEKLRAQIGARWQKNRRFARTDIPAFNLSLISDENELAISEEVTGSFKLLYDLSDDLMIYGSVERGFRPGGVTITSAASVLSEDLLLFDDESSDSIELGFKGTLFDRRLQLSGAIYQQTFDRHIVSTPEVAVDADLDGVFNPANFIDRTTPLVYGADATIRGAELEFNALLLNNWQLGGGVSYNDAEFDDGEQAPCTQLDGSGQPIFPTNEQVSTCDVGGQSIGGEPNWSASLHSEYAIDLGQYEGFIRGLYKFSEARINEDLGRQADSYGIVNLFTGIRDIAGRWEVSLWAKNLFDKEAERALYIPLPNGYREVEIIAPRTIGMTGKYNFSF